MNKKATNSPLELTGKERKDLRVLALFTAVYCRDHHPQRDRLPLESAEIDQPGKRHYTCCEECHEFLVYAIARRLRCPLEPKPMCKHCEVHCFRAGHREKVREIMRYSGKALLKKGRLDLLWHYFF